MESFLILLLLRPAVLAGYQPQHSPGAEMETRRDFVRHFLFGTTAFTVTLGPPQQAFASENKQQPSFWPWRYTKEKILDDDDTSSSDASMMSSEEEDDDGDSETSSDSESLDDE